MQKEVEIESGGHFRRIMIFIISFLFILVMQSKSTNQLDTISQVTMSNFLQGVRSGQKDFGKQGKNQKRNDDSAQPISTVPSSFISFKRQNSDNVSQAFIAYSPSKHPNSSKASGFIKEKNLHEKMAGYRELIQQKQRKLDQLKNNKIVGNNAVQSEISIPIKPSKSDREQKADKKILNTSIYKDFSDLFKKDLGPNFKVEKKQEAKKNPKPEEDPFLTLTFNKNVEMFQVIKFLDEGSYGKVFLARHLVTNLILCIKLIKKTSLKQWIFKRLIEEIRIQSRMDHPNIVNIYGYSSDAENVYLLLQPCLGQNIFKKLNNNPVKEKEVKKYVKEVCSAVEHMHEKDVIHRDIKAENILLHENTVKICDFGWAVYAPMLRNTQCGTPIYTPPEIVKHQYYDKKVDIWCVGVLTYELLYGTSPFEIRHPFDMAKIVEEQVFFSKEVKVTEEAKEFIERCLQKLPARRCNIKEALNHDFITMKLSEYRHTLG